MRVQRVSPSAGRVTYLLLDDAGEPVTIVADFLGHLTARDCSPNTVAAYAYDLKHFFQFLSAAALDVLDFTPVEAVALLAYLRQVPSHGPAQRRALVLCTSDERGAATRLAPATINRILAAVSSLYDYLIVAGRYPRDDNPIQRRADHALARVPDRHRPFLGHAGRQRPVRRTVRVATALRIPRPMSDEQVAALLGALHRLRDRAMVLLMLQGGLRPGEVLALHLEDIEYGRRRVVVRHRTDHPKGARPKSRAERVVDLHEPETLAAVSAYVMRERPPDAASPIVFLIGGQGARRHEPLGYQALVKLFRRRCARLGIRAPWVTPHALRHTHATRMWEGGMRELALQRRLGHASPESTRLYTRVSDAAVLAEYRRALGEEEG